MTRPRRSAEELGPPPPPVIIVWAEKWPVRELHTLAYYSGKGHVRVYPRNGYDVRLALGELFGGAPPLPYFRTALEAGAYIAGEARKEWEALDAARRLGGDPPRTNPFPGMCQVDARVAPSLGWSFAEIDPLALELLAPELLGRRR